VLFYHAHFFNGSETFIYQQAINPHVEPLLLAKRFMDSADMPLAPFRKFSFKRSKVEGAWSNLVSLFGIDRYYGSRSIAAIKNLLASSRVDVIHAQFGFSGVRILPLARAMKLPLVVSFHGLDASKLLSKFSYRQGLKEVFSYATAIVVCNPGMADRLPLSNEQRKKVVWIPYGIDVNRFSGSLLPAETKPTIDVLHVGRLVEKKGVPDLIRAFAAVVKQVPQAVLHLVGNGPEEEQCHRLVSTLGLGESVRFHGWKSPSEVSALMRQADVFMLNSRTARDGDTEGLPVGLLEAMAMGLPVVSTQHAGIPLAVEDNISGLLVPERDNEALTNQLLRLLQDGALRTRLGRAASARVVEQFTMDRMHERLWKVYDRVLN
jgi:glycosyltransferase involved in cell wall biosynthesis